ncbi:SPOR domain-containing protein [Vibrio sp. JPW-9-11-11]|uniref:SPOR domain-containing protein n=1 Tax=Vibrio sp. JPW-9-11-11 TaxID=1416532 RepID=UPI0015949897|nr:SPOR domain-containing protein [Vibrio sp. JPW-9-11-11]NVD08115.1 SPOR domain-containing protein [Vibrio sp. JPW-9-11-11]
MASMPNKTYWKQWTLLAALAVPFWSPAVLAEEFLCDATQASTNQLPVLDTNCPVGNGLWGKSPPKGSQSTFWIQCGVFGQPLSLPKAKLLYKQISTDVWAKPEGKAYRCLIGPYNDFAIAKQELAKIQTEPGYKQAFIREVVKGAPAKAPKPMTKPVTTPKPAKQATTVIPAPVKAQPVAAPPTKAQNQGEKEVTIRLSTKVAGVEYKVPYAMFSDDQFYMEHELPWNRMDYQGAYKMCQRLGMRLATPQEWQALLDSGMMAKAKWPMHLPYWGAERTGLFTSGKVNQLKGTSLLNVICVN